VLVSRREARGRFSLVRRRAGPGGEFTVRVGKRWRLVCSICTALVSACASDDRSSRPPLVPPTPPQDVITVAGFDDAMHIGSDYIYAQKLPDRVFIGSQELPGNLWLLRFGPESGGGAPVDLVIDSKSGKVVRREVPVASGAAAELKTTPSDAPSAPPPEPTPRPPPLMPSDAPTVPE
jgi:hypothetical protein